jgi:hypothetical protein
MLGLTESFPASVLAPRWEMAAAAFQRAVERQPENPELRHWLALCRLAAGDLPGYRKVCGATLERFGFDDAPGIASRVAYTCVAGPDAVEDRVQLIQICKNAIPAFKGNERIVGAAFVRDGRFAEGVQQFDASHRTFPPRAWDWISRVMACHGLGQSAEARDCLKKATSGSLKQTGKPRFRAKALNRNGYTGPNGSRSRRYVARPNRGSHIKE